MATSGWDLRPSEPSRPAHRSWRSPVRRRGPLPTTSPRSDGAILGGVARVEIDWTRTVGGALAAVASAVLLSTLGAAGTILGAALGSIVVTVSGAYFA